VTRYERWNGGYRVWLGGVTYPFWVPLSYYNRYPFRVGLSIRLGGYYNSLGYYEYYDGYNDGYYAGAYRDGGRSIAAGILRGTVESVDYRRGTFVLRNDATGNFVTVSTRDRYVRDMRAGDYIEVDGDWNRSGYFVADTVDLIDARDRDRYRDDEYDNR